MGRCSLETGSVPDAALEDEADCGSRHNWQEPRIRVDEKHRLEENNTHPKRWKIADIVAEVATDIDWQDTAAVAKHKHSNSRDQLSRCSRPFPDEHIHIPLRIAWAFETDRRESGQARELYSRNRRDRAETARCPILATSQPSNILTLT